MRRGEIRTTFMPFSKSNFSRCVSFTLSVKFSPSTDIPYTNALFIIGWSNVCRLQKYRKKARYTNLWSTKLCTTPFFNISLAVIPPLFLQPTSPYSPVKPLFLGQIALIFPNRFVVSPILCIFALTTTINDKNDKAMKRIYVLMAAAGIVLAGCKKDDDGGRHRLSRACRLAGSRFRAERQVGQYGRRCSV